MTIRGTMLILLAAPLSMQPAAPALAQGPAPSPSGDAPAASGQPNRYRLSGEPDVASWLLLWPNGRFEYMLSAGALDEQAAGRWIRSGDTIFLTTLPKPKPPEFSLVKSERVDAAPLSIKVEWPNGRGIAGIDLRVTFRDGESLTGYTQEDGWALPSDEERTPMKIELAVLMHGLRSQPFPIDLSKTNKLTFLLTPNQLGVIDFKEVPISVNGDQLIMRRGGGSLTYRIEKGGPGH